VRTGTQGIVGENDAMLQRWMTRFGLQNSVPGVFLNCTKNAELTAQGFARTVVFALTKIKSQPSGRNWWRRALQQSVRQQ
jgi:hypothetical protein